MFKKEYLDLQKILSERINGRIYVTMRGDILIVHINTGKKVFKRKFDYTYKCIIMKEITDVRCLADNIEYDYKKYLISKRRLDYAI